MSMHKVTLLVRHVANGQLVGLYVRAEMELPFVPTVGMQFKQGTSTWLWETDSGELMPSIETVTYDLDDGVFVCLFTVDQPLKASFWTPISRDKLANSSYVPYFQPRN
ncbi:hypothetical protein NM04_11240 [Massilia aurea]|uniref:Uncharacterized protein n=1 Tax=Massilia aurea TaxID=373040 RepID=A0A422QL23_9BURK|nr:hypothetical protein [Massilia aurea]RNF30687.1 hypothetical protein NM04_11240 [Massilia aurea]